MDVKEWENTVWKIFDAYFAEKNVATMQIESYDDFIVSGLPRIVEQESIFIGSQQHKITFSSPRVDRPCVIEENRKSKYAYPSDARARGLSYISPIYCDIKETYFEGEKEVTVIHPMQVIGHIPVMLRSSICNLSFLTHEERVQTGECPYDHGGYFIIKGHERILTAQVRANYNTILVIKQTSTEKKYSHTAEVRSMSAETGHSVLVQALISHDERSINFSLPSIKEHIPAGIVFKALGMENSQEIIDVIAMPELKDDEKRQKYKNLVNSIVNNACICSTQKEALKYIGHHAMHTISEEKRETYAWQVVETELFPHLGISGTIKENAYFLGCILRKLLMVILGLRTEDDRDNLAMKRVDISGGLIYELFRNLFKKFVSSVKNNLEKKKRDTNALPTILRTKMTKTLLQSFASGNWTVQKSTTYVKTGVSQVAERMSPNSEFAHLKRIMLPVGKEGKNAAIRMIHPSQYGYICPSETPEGQKVGIVLNFALFSEVSTHIPTIDVKRVLACCKFIKNIQTIKIEDYKKLIPVFLNGIIIGFVSSEKSVDKLKKLRSRGKLHKNVSISYDFVDNEIRLFCDEGRFIRPLLTVKTDELSIVNLDLKTYSWKTLVEKSYIQYVDPAETEWSVIAMTPNMLKEQKSDYCEIHPCTMLGIMGSIIPFPDHSQSPRNCYQCSMGKQALGVPLLSYNLRTDTLLRLLHHSQKPIISTKPSKYLGFNEMVSGINAMVAISPWAGYNQEDSIVANSSAGQRGFMVLSSYRTIEDSEKKRDTYSQEKICVPPETTQNLKPEEKGYFRRKNANYSFLDENGIIKSKIPYERKCDNAKCTTIWYPGLEKKCPECGKIGFLKRGGNNITVKKGDVIVGKIIVMSARNTHETKTDISRVIEDGEEGIVDRVHIYTTPNGYKMVKVVIRKVSETILGDKMASREAQKGTVGRTFHEIDLPYTDDGISPDIIINPLCMPSRMTINQLIECTYAKICCMEGIYGDATPFTERSKNIADKLMKDEYKKMDASGLNRNGEEKMRNGFTGVQIFKPIFFGPTYYQKLKHLVSEKLHARARGPCSTLTRQPLEGRARDGGLRFGEMERDCMISHGASEFLQERLYTVSDKFQIPQCEICGFTTNNLRECQMCKSNSVKVVKFPYASKLMIQELTQLGLKIRIFPQK